jgi:hypothetical protein
MVTALHTLGNRFGSLVQEANNRVPYQQRGTEFWEQVNSWQRLQRACLNVNNSIGSAFPEVRLRQRVVDPNRYAAPSTSGAGPSRLPSAAAVPPAAAGPSRLPSTAAVPPAAGYGGEDPNHRPTLTPSPNLLPQSSAAPQQRADHPLWGAPTFGQGAARQQSPKPPSPGR